MNVMGLRWVPARKGGGVSKVRCPAVCWEPMKLHKAAHTVYKTQYHIVWVTRYRRKILGRGIAASLRIQLQEVRKFPPDWFIEEIGIEVDHVHLHMIIPRRMRWQRGWPH
jgi:Transposase IS200 like